MTDAATEVSVHGEGDKGTAFLAKSGMAFAKCQRGRGLAVESGGNALCRYSFQQLSVCVVEGELLGFVVVGSNNGEGMVAYDSMVVVVAYITRILVEEVTYLVLFVKHEQEGNDGEGSAGARREVAYATVGVLIKCVDELLHIAGEDGLGGPLVHLSGIFVGRIM